MLQKLVDLGPVMKMISLPRARQRLHTMPTSTGYDVRSSWDGRRRWQTPFTVMQHTHQRHRKPALRNQEPDRIAPGETMLLVVPHSHRYWVEKGRALGVLSGYRCMGRKRCESIERS